MICIPWLGIESLYGSKFPVMELHWSYTTPFLRDAVTQTTYYVGKSPFIWYDFTFLVGISFRIVVLGLLLDQGHPFRMRLHQCD